MITQFAQFPILRTGRLMLREISQADAPLIHRLRSDEETNALIDRKKSNGIDDAVVFIDMITKNLAAHASLYWIICLENSSDLIGTICFYNYDLLSDTAEVGYELLTEYRGRGIMNEVLPAVIRFGFEQMKLKTITGFPSARNVASVKLLEKFSFNLADAPYVNMHEQVPGMLTYVLSATNEM